MKLVDAQALVTKAEKIAQRDGFSISVSVVDVAGLQVLFSRMDGTALGIDTRGGRLEQAERAEGLEFGLRVLIGQRSAVVSGSDARPEVLAAMAERAVASRFWMCGRREAKSARRARLRATSASRAFLMPRRASLARREEVRTVMLYSIDRSETMAPSAASGEWVSVWSRAR